tara:strand:+ start:627 stop:944 length:318 start_codon:yes stop_codon:yes gene_type:complete
MTTKLVRKFRGMKVPDYITSKSQLIAWALLISRKQNKPITNGEFVFDLRCTRYGGVIHDLRKKGWRIETTNEGNSKFTFRLTKQPVAYGLSLAYQTIIKKEGQNV